MVPRLIFFGGAICLAASHALAVDPQSVAKMIEPSVVRVIAIGPEGEASGSGFVVSRDGHVVTNFHIVEPHIEANWKIFVAESGVALKDRRPANLVKAFPGEDLAVLKIEGLTLPLVQLSEIDAERPAIGMTVFAIGFPGAGGRLAADVGTSFTAGSVSRLFTGAWSEEGPQIPIIQHSAPTNPGNSGGPIVNACGQVVGVNSQRELAILLGPGGLPIVTDLIQGVFFASHGSVLVEKLKSLGIAYSGTRKVCRVFLGIPSTNFYLYGAIAVFIGLAFVGILLVYRPRSVVQVVVRCGCAVRDCATAVRRILRDGRFGRRLVSRDQVVDEQAAACAPQAPCAPHETEWRLTGAVGDGETIEIVVTTEDLRRPDGIVIGSDPSTDKTLNESCVSLRHARLVAHDDGLAVMDLHSVKGTFVDGNKLLPDAAPTPASEGSCIRLGNVTLRIERR